MKGMIATDVTIYEVLYKVDGAWKERKKAPGRWRSAIGCYATTDQGMNYQHVTPVYASSPLQCEALAVLQAINLSRGK